MNILFNSPGRRVELISLFKKTFPNETKIYGTDYNRTSPASYILDKVFKVPYKIDNIYANKILKICKKNKINLVIPLIDPELLYLSKIRDKFENENINLMVSSYDKIKISYDKYKTYKFLNKNNLPTFKTWLPSQISKNKINLPVIIKPRKGSSAKGIKKINKRSDLELAFRNINDDHIIQKYIDGYEVTVSIFGDEKGNSYEIVQRKRLKIRGGEVERGITIKDNEIFSLTKEFVSKFRPKGAINIQFIVEGNDYRILEINPRFGGGYPLAHQAGANFPKMLLNKMNNIKNRVNIGNYIENLYMLRYDKAIYTKELVKLC